MAAGDYQYRIKGTASGGELPSVTSNGRVDFQIRVERSEGGAPEVWVLIPHGHFTLSVPGAQLEAAGSPAAVRQGIAQLILDRGLTASDRARQALLALLPGGVWPATDITEPL